MSCFFIDEQYPELEDKLTLEMKFLTEHTKNQGVFEASLGFGLFWPLQMDCCVGHREICAF
jgi:hypothetical protein